MASPYDKTPGKIFVGGIPPSVTQSDLQKHFNKFGDVSDCVIMQDKVTGKSRGFGFVTFKDSQVISKVLKEVHKLDGKEVDCKNAVPRDQSSGPSGDYSKDDNTGRTKKIFVGGLPQSTTEDEFKGYFEKFGHIEDSVIMVDKETGKSRGFGFITFDNEDSVEKVIEGYQNHKIDDKWVECKKAFPRTNQSSGNKRGGSGSGGAGGSRPRYTRDYGDQGGVSHYGANYGGGPKEDPYYSAYGGGAGPEGGAGYGGGYYPKTNYPGYHQSQDYYDERAGYWSGASNPYNPQYMGQYSGQGYPAYGAHPDPHASYGGPPMESAHPGMVPQYNPSGYAPGPYGGGYAGGMPSNYAPGDQSLGGPGEGPSAGGPIKGKSMQSRDDRFYKPY